jgi:hypothetical protein
MGQTQPPAAGNEALAWAQHRVLHDQVTGRQMLVRFEQKDVYVALLATDYLVPSNDAAILQPVSCRRPSGAAHRQP